MLTLKESLLSIPYHLFEEACAEHWKKYDSPFPAWSLRASYETIMRTPAISSDKILLVHKSDAFCETPDAEIFPEYFEISSLFYESDIREIQEKYGTGDFLEIIKRRIRRIDASLEEGTFLKEDSEVFDTGILPTKHDVSELKWEEIPTLLTFEETDSSSPVLKRAHDAAVLFFDALWYGFSKEEFEGNVQNLHVVEFNQNEGKLTDHSEFPEDIRRGFYEIEMQDLRYKYEIVEKLFESLLAEEKAD